MDKLFEVPATKKKASLYPYEEYLTFTVRLKPRRDNVESFLDEIGDHPDRVQLLHDKLAGNLYDEIQAELEFLAWEVEGSMDFAKYVREVLSEIDQPTWIDVQPASNVIQYLVDVPK